MTNDTNRGQANHMQKLSIFTSDRHLSHVYTIPKRALKSRHKTYTTWSHNSPKLLVRLRRSVDSQLTISTLLSTLWTYAFYSKLFSICSQLGFPSLCFLSLLFCKQLSRHRSCRLRHMPLHQPKCNQHSVACNLILNTYTCPVTLHSHLLQKLILPTQHISIRQKEKLNVLYNLMGIVVHCFIIYNLMGLLSILRGDMYDLFDSFTESGNFFILF
jgi:hypothetical protein